MSFRKKADGPMIHNNATSTCMGNGIILFVSLLLIASILRKHGGKTGEELKAEGK